MQYSESIGKCPKEEDREETQKVDWEKAFECIKDPRRNQRKQYSLAAIFFLTLAALLCNHHSVLAIAEWGHAQKEEVKQALGFKKGKTPHQTTLQRLLRRLDPHQVEEAFRQIFLQLSEEPREERGAIALAIDGKAQRGRLKFEEEDAYKIHAVSVCAHETGMVAFQGHVAPLPKTEEK